MAKLLAVLLKLLKLTSKTTTRLNPIQSFKAYLFSLQ